MYRFFLAFILAIFLFPAQSFSSDFLRMQVIQDQLVFDNTTIYSVFLIEKNGVYRGLRIVLKPSAVKDIVRLSVGGLGKKMNLVFNNKIISTAVIQSPLGGDLQISGISKEDAEEFISNLNHIKEKTMENKVKESVPQ